MHYVGNFMFIIAYCKTGNFDVIRNLMQRIWQKKCWQNASKSTYFCFILYAYLARLLYFERLKFGDLTPICQIHQFPLAKFLVLRYWIESRVHKI